MASVGNSSPSSARRKMGALAEWLINFFFFFFVPRFLLKNILLPDDFSTFLLGELVCCIVRSNSSVSRSEQWTKI